MERGRVRNGLYVCLQAIFLYRNAKSNQGKAKEKLNETSKKYAKKDLRVSR